jgi:hypothetical protein
MPAPTVMVYGPIGLTAMTLSNLEWRTPTLMGPAALAGPASNVIAGALVEGVAHGKAAEEWNFL